MCRGRFCRFFFFNLGLVRFRLETDEKIGKSMSTFSVVDESRRMSFLRAFQYALDLVCAFSQHKSVYWRGQSLFFDFFEDFLVKLWVG